MAQLTQQDFLDYSGYSLADVNTQYLDFLLDSVEDQIVNYLDEKFSFETISSGTPKRYFGNGTDFVKIGCWQSVSVVKGFIGSSQTESLIEDRDYYLVQVLSNKTLPTIYALNLVGETLDRHEFLKISGQKGFSSSFPNDIKNLVFNLVKEKLEYNKTNTDTLGKGLVQNEKDLTSSVAYANSDKTTENKRMNTFDSLANPELKRIFNWYKQFTKSEPSLIV